MFLLVWNEPEWPPSRPRPSETLSCNWLSHIGWGRGCQGQVCAAGYWTPQSSLELSTRLRPGPRQRSSEPRTLAMDTVGVGLAPGHGRGVLH